MKDVKVVAETSLYEGNRFALQSAEHVDYIGPIDWSSVGSFTTQERAETVMEWLSTQNHRLCYRVVDARPEGEGSTGW